MATKKSNPFLGHWRITGMNEWDQDYVDLVVPGFIEFDEKGSGEFQFGTVRGFLDCRLENDHGKKRMEFSWQGENDTDPGYGRGWATVEGNEMMGHIFIHMSDDSEFLAIRGK